MTETAVQKPRYGIELPAVRRFELADITQHGKWLIPRIVKQFPHMSQQQAWQYLNNVLYSSEYYFCYQPHAAGLAQVERAHALTPTPIVREKFVWVEDPKDASQIDEAAAFYKEFETWAKHLGASIIIVREASDVPEDTIRKLFDSRLFNREQKFVKLT